LTDRLTGESLRHDPQKEIMILPSGYLHRKGRLAIGMGRARPVRYIRQAGVMMLLAESSLWYSRVGGASGKYGTAYIQNATIICGEQFIKNLKSTKLPALHIKSGGTGYEDKNDTKTWRYILG
jgi:hypothetical protein